MDYRKILQAYIDHVGRQEGVDYLPAQLDGLTNAENSALCFTAAELDGCTAEHRDDLIKRGNEWSAWKDYRKDNT